MIHKWLHPIARVLIIIAVPVVLTVIAVRITMTPAFLTFEYTRDNFPADPYGFTTEQRLQYGPPAVEYLLNSAPISFLGDMRLPREQVPIGTCIPAPEDDTLCRMYNDRELRHMLDVKIVTVWTYVTGIVLSMLGIAAGVYHYRQDRAALRGSLWGGAVLTLGIIAAIIVTALTAWDAFFTGFHLIFFEGDSWRFYYSDTLIRLFPEQLWFDAALIIGIVTCGGAVIVAAFSWAWHIMATRQITNDNMAQTTLDQATET